MTDDAGRKALADLVEKLEFCRADQAYRSVWTINHIHAGPYRGPTYTAELESAKAALRLPLPATASREAIRGLVVKHAKNLTHETYEGTYLQHDGVNELTDAILALAPVQSATLEAIIEECARVAEGPLYGKSYRGKSGNNWWHTKQSGHDHAYGNGRHDAASAIRDLSSVPADERGEPKANTATFLGYRTKEGHEMHCAHAFCPHRTKCNHGCVNRVARAAPNQPDERGEGK